MKAREFIHQLDDARITAAIERAEMKSSGEIRVYVSHREHHDALAFAEKRFVELGMTRTRDRNAVLLYFVPRTQQFAIVGDQGIHAKCGPEFWQEIAAFISSQLKEGHFTEAVVEGIEKVGDALARWFPRKPDDRNELPNVPVREP